MYGRRPLNDANRAAKAILSNQLARFAPGIYVRLTGQTGRGSEPETVSDIAGYFRRCFDDYFLWLGVEPSEISAWLMGRHLLEYGPGDVPGVGLLMVAHGADKVTCVDRFALVQSSPKQVAVLQQLIDDLDGVERERARACFNRPGDPSSGFSRNQIDYLVTRNGLSGLNGEVDMIYSRAVLEHVNDLEATFRDMMQALRPDGLMIHQVDLKSHGLHRENPLDFLTWPRWLWELMYSGKGVPNRWRIDAYRMAIEMSGFDVQRMEPTLLAKQADMDEVRPWLAGPFQGLDDDELSWLGFWLIARKPDGSDIHPGF